MSSSHFWVFTGDWQTWNLTSLGLCFPRGDISGNLCKQSGTSLCPLQRHIRSLGHQGRFPGHGPGTVAKAHPTLCLLADP